MEPQTTPNPITVVIVNGRQFVSGLTWKTLEHYRTHMKEARKWGKENGMAVVAIRKGGILQAGYAPKSDERLRGMYSLAAALAGQLGDNWIGVFPLPDDRFAFVAVNDGAVMVGRDMIGDRYNVDIEYNEAINLLHGEKSWQGHIVAPEGWDFATRHETLEELLNPKLLHKDYRLQPLTFGLSKREVVMICVGLLVVAGGGVGFLKWQSIQEQKKADAATEAMISLQKEQEEQARKAAEEARKNLVRPWQELPSVETFLSACNAFWGETELSLGGWIFSGGQCGPGKAMASFKRLEDGTTVAEFAAAVRAAHGQQPAVYEQGTSGSYAATFALTATKDDTLPPVAVQMEAFTSHLQTLGKGTTLALQEKPWKAPDDQPDAVPPDWITNGFTIDTDASPSMVFSGLNTAGMRVMEVTTTLNPESAALTWKITGELYGR